MVTFYFYSFNKGDEIMDRQKKLFLEQTSRENYFVKKVKNATAPKIGELLSANEVNELMYGSNGYEIEITAQKK